MPVIKKLGASVQEYEALIERYKVQNPVKAKAKEAEFARKLEALKAQNGELTDEKPKKK